MLESFPDIPRPSPRFHSTGRGFYFNHKLNVLSAPISRGTLASAVAASHELSHFYWHSGTPYGSILDDLTDMSNELVLAYCARHSIELKAEPLIVPVYEFALAWAHDGDSLWLRHREHAEASSLLAWYVQPWASLQLLEHILEGTDSLTVRDARDVDAIAAVNVFESFAALQDTPWLFGDLTSFVPIAAKAAPVEQSTILSAADVAGHDLSAVPRHGDKLLGAMHLIEGVAHHVQGDRDKVDPATVDNVQFPYVFLWIQTQLKFGLQRIRSQADYDRVNRTFLALADLSLFLPLGPLYGPLRLPNSVWSDLQPAARFLLALEVVSRRDLWIATLAESESLADAVCRETHWPRPRLFLERGAALETNHPPRIRHRAACRERLKRFDAFFIDFADYPSLLMDHAPLLVNLSQPDVLMMPSVTKDTLNGLLHNVFRYSRTILSWRIMTEGTEWTFPSLLPNMDWSLVAADMDAESMSAILAKAHPYLHEAHVRPL